MPVCSNMQPAHRLRVRATSLQELAGQLYFNLRYCIDPCSFVSAGQNEGWIFFKMYLFLQVVFQQNSPSALTSTGILPSDGHPKRPWVGAGRQRWTDSLGERLGDGELL